MLEPGDRTVSIDALNIWCDQEASWQDDEIFLPGDFCVEDLPYNAPSIGWDALERVPDDAIVGADLPATVEEYFWGRFQKTDYTIDEYVFAAWDPDAKNGSYRGVSWWWNKIDVPDDWQGRYVNLHIPAARLRAEVFINRQLVGYDIVGETPFQADCSRAVVAGAPNWLAIRLTNPGGRMDWLDAVEGAVKPLVWGRHVIPYSKSFGGLDGGIELRVSDDLSIEDIFVRNLRSITKVDVTLQIDNRLPRPETYDLELSVYEYERSAPPKWSRTLSRLSAHPGSSTQTINISMSEAKLWSPSSPNLYRLVATIRAGAARSEMTQHFGFRWFDAVGIGRCARLRLNDKRVVLRSAISWSFWPNNGLFPTRGFAERQTEAALQLGLTMISFHRCLASALALRQQDEDGLLSGEEPGGGAFAFHEDAFARRYMREKIRRMIVRDRSSPSLVIYVLQNEQLGLAADDEDLRGVMTMMHDLDPTRLIVNKSAWSAHAEDKVWHSGRDNHEMAAASPYRNNVAYFLPGDDTYYHSNDQGWAGWWDQHSVSGPTVWRDYLYQGPKKLSHYSGNQSEIVLWGEAFPSPSPENLEAVEAYYRDNPSVYGYTREDHQALYRAYDRFLDEKNFREAFPSVGSLTRALGNRSYHYWGRLLENIRIADFVDGVAISGWEANSIECACGLVDQFRNLKGDPALIEHYTRPLHLAIKAQATSVAVGEHSVVDVFVINEDVLSGPVLLELSLQTPNGSSVPLGVTPFTVTGGDRFSQLVVEGLIVGPFETPGYYRIQGRLSSARAPSVDGHEAIFVVEASPPAGLAKLEIRESGSELRDFLDGETARAPSPGADVIVAAAKAQFCRQLTREEIAARYVTGEPLQSGADVPLWPDKNLLARVAMGARLILLADDAVVAAAWAAELDALGVGELEKMVGPARSVWMGCWAFVKDHPLFEGLPVNTGLGWEYQADPRGRKGVWFGTSDIYGWDAPSWLGGNVEYVVGYGRDHDRNFGAAVSIIRHGSGIVIYSSMAGLYDALGSGRGMSRPVARRLVSNFVRFAAAYRFSGPADQLSEEPGK